ncbi:MAG TPA: VOC family protein [Thermoanaerobaculia bacterium]|jgi:predicted enzyme related to lactoylglutathione lyase|nr:VOC family protein [Thermoanaerobaculia bacterium]
MERVTGIGGVFFRAQNPKELKKWYVEHLGAGPASLDNPYEPWQQEAGPTAFEPFPTKTDYFGRESQQWMLNFRVRDLDAMVAQLRAAGIEVTVNTENFDFGRFAHLDDPEGNRIELWQAVTA